MSITTEQRNEIILSMVVRLKMIGTASALCVDLISSGVDVKLVHMLEDAAIAFLNKYPNFDPFLGDRFWSP